MQNSINITAWKVDKVNCLNWEMAPAIDTWGYKGPISVVAEIQSSFHGEPLLWLINHSQKGWQLQKYLGR